jgi:hypothetical protein
MSLVNRLVWIFVSPARVFAEIREGNARWWQPWIWQSVIYLIAGYLSLPIQRAVMELNVNDLSPDDLAKQLEFMDRFGVLQILATPVLLLLFSLALAGITYVLVTILSSKANFRQYFTITLYASIIGALSMLVSTVVVRMRGVETIRVPEDAQVSLGLGFLVPEGMWHAVLNSVEVFAVWSLILIGMGLMHVFDMTRKQAVACVIPWWVIIALFAIMGQAFGGLG